MWSNIGPSNRTGAQDQLAHPYGVTTSIVDNDDWDFNEAHSELSEVRAAEKPSNSSVLSSIYLIILRRI